MGQLLIDAAKGEQDSLREELKTVLDELTYNKLVESDANLAESTQNLQAKIPLAIFVG